MNKLRELCEKWLEQTNAVYCEENHESDCLCGVVAERHVAELRAILPDVERLETEVANLKAHREKFEKANGELTDYAYLCKLEGQVERLVELLRAVREELQSFCIDEERP